MPGSVGRLAERSIVAGTVWHGLVHPEIFSREGDIESLNAVEAGQRVYDGVLLVVSHGETFLEAIGISRRLVLGKTAR